MRGVLKIPNALSEALMGAMKVLRYLVDLSQSICVYANILIKDEFYSRGYCANVLYRSGKSETQTEHDFP